MHGDFSTSKEKIILRGIERIVSPRF